ncbi:unnamed protein product, partial [Closterium sp. NIES-54]
RVTVPLKANRGTAAKSEHIVLCAFEIAEDPLGGRPVVAREATRCNVARQDTDWIGQIWSSAHHRVHEGTDELRVSFITGLSWKQPGGRPFDCRSSFTPPPFPPPICCFTLAFPPMRMVVSADHLLEKNWRAAFPKAGPLWSIWKRSIFPPTTCRATYQKRSLHSPPSPQCECYCSLNLFFEKSKETDAATCPPTTCMATYQKRSLHSLPSLHCECCSPCPIMLWRNLASLQ